MLTVYHGSTIQVNAPIAKAGRDNLDFGQGFYITDIKEQAERWASRMGRQLQKSPMLNIYELDIERIKVNYRYLKAQHQPNNQFCLLNQSLIDECLHFISVEQLKS